MIFDDAQLYSRRMSQQFTIEDKCTIVYISPVLLTAHVQTSQVSCTYLGARPHSIVRTELLCPYQFEAKALGSIWRRVEAALNPSGFSLEAWRHDRSDE